MLKHDHMVICFYKNTNASRLCVAIMDKRGLDDNMTQFNTKEQAALLLPLCYVTICYKVNIITRMGVVENVCKCVYLVLHYTLYGFGRLQ